MPFFGYAPITRCGNPDRIEHSDTYKVGIATM
ncbi:Uncharacterised protein [Pseudomonas aeruginosa]|nr:Uncharacterised protein [Pseudomonas aeruginosa]